MVSFFPVRCQSHDPNCNYFRSYYTHSTICIELRDLEWQGGAGQVKGRPCLRRVRVKGQGQDQDVYRFLTLFPKGREGSHHCEFSRKTFRHSRTWASLVQRRRKECGKEEKQESAKVTWYRMIGRSGGSGGEDPESAWALTCKGLPKTQREYSVLSTIYLYRVSGLGLKSESFSWGSP